MKKNWTQRQNTVYNQKKWGRKSAPMEIKNMLVIKYIISILIISIIVLAPAWLARQNKRSKQDNILIRLASWIFGWTGIGWLWSLFWSAKK